MKNKIVLKMWKMLTEAERRQAVILIFMMLLGTVLETLGVGLVVPVLTLITQSDVGEKYPIYQSAIAHLGNPDQHLIVLYAMLILVLVYLVKSTFLLILTWFQMRFAFGVQAQISHRLFGIYLLQPYAFHLKRNSAKLIHNVITEVNLITGNALLPGMIFISEVMVLIGLSCLLFFMEPIGASIVVLVLGGASWAFHFSTHKRIEKWGGERQYHERFRLHHLQQGLNGVKEIKVLGRELKFLENYEAHNLQSARVGMMHSTLAQLPRLWIEMVAISGLAILVITMFARGSSVESILPSLGLFAAAAFRLMPSVNRLLSSLQSLRYGLPMIKILDEELNLSTSSINVAIGVDFKFQSEIELRNIDYFYANTSTPSLQNISLKIRRGESIGFIGPSGSGKSTIVDIILGLLEATKGEVLVDGVNIQENLRGWQKQIGYVPQTIYLTDDTLLRNIAFGVADDEINMKSVASAINDAQLGEFIEQLPEGLQTVVGERGVRISGGQRQRIGIARALYHDPSILILDEATSALDVKTEAEVMDSIKALHQSKTIIIVAHRLSTVEHCDHLFKLNSGHLG